ncbi:Hint domain-containing protein [Tabrizicola sp. YIM 78059]|uniref:Hint domain-containing protein n=1 Tax=Tabrizicola sp. YIM 78059 TaxID=2529861 RepID=UPI00145B3B91|nr:Hint domain-containing protein [Tabrizicola sp. YIM 78059]
MDTTSHISGIRVDSGATTLTGVLEGTRIATMDGLLPVEYLQPGDRIVTRTGGRKLLAISVLRRRAMELVRVRGSVLGHGRPEEDLLLAPGQCLLIRDWRARALYGRDFAAIPAARLEDGEFVLREFHGQVRLYTLRFEEDAVIYAEGLELACPALAHEESGV